MCCMLKFYVSFVLCQKWRIKHVQSINLTCFWLIFFLKLIVILIDSYTAFMDYSILCVCCPRKTFKFAHSLTLFNHVGRSFNLFKCHHRGCLNFSKAGLFAASWAHFMCRRELLPTGASHLFAFLNRRKTSQESSNRYLFTSSAKFNFCRLLYLYSVLSYYSPYFCSFRRWWKIFW